jgi:hypothetical protein
MQHKIGFASIVTLIAMLFVMTALGGNTPASETAALGNMATQAGQIATR